MSNTKNTGGPAFPTAMEEHVDGILHYDQPGMTLRDYFAAHMQEDDRLVKCVRAMDDTALELFALHSGAEREEAITETGMLAGSTMWHAMSAVEKVATRLELEAKAIARVRYMQADAMLKAREQ
jgi:hypothetical protein